MNDTKLTLGLDFGTLSCRAVLVDCARGDVLGEASMAYPHGVLSEVLPDGTPLPEGWALQHPRDYVDALLSVVPAVMRQTGADPSRVAGIGVDFTASTVVPVDRELRPLCLDPAWASRPHAWVKLWKHHGASREAQDLTRVCREHGAPYLRWYGGSISPECLLAKVLQVYREDRQVYDAAECFMEAGDYVSSLLAGEPVFGLAAAAAKAFWCREGYPEPDFLEKLAPGFGTLPKDKLMDRFPHAKRGHPGERVGSLCRAMAEKLGLPPGIAVSAPQMDAYAAMPALGITRPGTVLLVIGTSTAVLLMHERYQAVEGVTACLPDTYYPGLYGYGSGQASVGDTFQWFVDNCLPAGYVREAEKRGMSAHSWLSQLAGRLRPGESGLLALDWLNGNRSCLANSRLSGMLLGLRLETRPEHIYRALMEGTAFGARAILDGYAQAGVPVREAVACGGAAVSDPVLMQMYADVLGMPLRVSLCTQTPALGAAIQAACAAGLFPDLFTAARTLGHPAERLFAPDREQSAAYGPLYREYLRLYDLFGRGKDPAMETLRTLSEPYQKSRRI